MKKILHITVKEYAKKWNKSAQAIYRRIEDGKLLSVPEPDGGRGVLIPVCNCLENTFPGCSLCIACKKELEKVLEKQV